MRKKERTKGYGGVEKKKGPRTREETMTDGYKNRRTMEQIKETVVREKGKNPMTGPVRTERKKSNYGINRTRITVSTDKKRTTKEKAISSSGLDINKDSVGKLGGKESKNKPRFKEEN